MSPKTSSANGAESAVDIISARAPFLSYNNPNIIAEAASTSIAPAYRSGSVPLLTREVVSDSPCAMPPKERDTCMMISE
ncbi:MAG: hypothetical protein R2912_12125 [Eubacteriales bacterium]